MRANRSQLSEELLSFIDSWIQIWNPAERGGYSGCLTLTKIHPNNIEFGLGIDNFDREGRVIVTQFEGFTLLNVYFPNGGRDSGRLAYKLAFYEQMLAYCKELMAKGEQVILCGDFNTAHREIDLKNPDQNQNTSGFLPQEREWIDEYIKAGFVDIYRYLYPDRVQYTWWTYRYGARRRNIGWRLDYFLLTEGLMDMVEDVVIHDEVAGSDHCPVSLFLKISPTHGLKDAM